MSLQFKYACSVEHNRENIFFNDKFIEDLTKIFNTEPIDMILFINILKRLDSSELINFLIDNKKSIMARKIWFMYETFIEELKINSIHDELNYETILNDELQVTLKTTSFRSDRHKIINNMISSGSLYICIERTEFIKEQEIGLEINPTANNNYSNDHINEYIYKKEMLFSHLIEKEKVKNSNFNQMEYLKCFQLDIKHLVDAQNQIVDLEFKSKKWRDRQIYIGNTTQSINYKFTESYDYICPKPEDVESLMDDFFSLNKKLEVSNLNIIIQATILSFVFNYIHPFDDGNGRLSRFLVNWLLFCKKNHVYPISAVIFDEISEYYTILNEFSISIHPFIKFNKNEDGSIDVINHTVNLYQLFNLTKQTEYLFRIFNKATKYRYIEYQSLSIHDELNKNFPNIDIKYIKLLILNGKIGAKKKKKCSSNLDELTFYFERMIKSKLDDQFCVVIKKMNKV